jgi:tricorn protease
MCRPFLRVKHPSAGTLGARAVAMLIATTCWGLPRANPSAPLLLRDPTVSRTRVAFSYAGDIWIAERNGSSLRRLTNGGHDTKPVFSPDGNEIAFAGDAGGDRAVYVVPVAGGQSRRLTFHPADLGNEGLGPLADFVGWTPDGRDVLFNSRRSSFAWWTSQLIAVQLFAIPAEGGPAQRVPLQRATQGSLSPDGKRIAYVPNAQWEKSWKHYRGGQTTPIRIANLADSRIEAEIPRDNSNDFNPIWIADTIYFLSDREGPVTLFSYELQSRRVRRVVENNGLDIDAASGIAGTIVYEQFGSLHLLDLETGANRALDIQPRALRKRLQPSQKKVEAAQIRLADLSPDGNHAAFGARGEILTVDVKTGQFQNLTSTTSAVERDPAWSSDGRSIAYFSDESGEYALHIRALEQRGGTLKIGLGDPPGFYYSPTWSPDGKKIAYTDKRLNYWYVDLKSRRPVRVDTDLRVEAAHRLQLAWSPDSRWIAYTKQLPNQLHAVFVYSLERQQIYQLTSPPCDALFVDFDKSGELLYFTGSTDIGLNASAAEDMTSLQQPVTRRVYATALPGSAAGAEPVALPIPPRNYYGLTAGEPGIVYLIEGPSSDPLPTAHSEGLATTATSVVMFDAKTGQTRTILNDVTYFFDQHLASWHLAANGKRMLYAKGERWIVDSVSALPDDPTGPDRKPVNFDLATIYSDPRREWAHLFDQVLRDERDFFIDPAMHGIDLSTMRKTYRPYLENMSSRADLNYLFREMLGNLSVSHSWVAGGEDSRSEGANVGLLGADYTVENDRYRFDRIYRGEYWDQDNRAPLGRTGIREGEYLLAVNGRDVRPTAEVFSFFVGTAEKPTVLTVGPQASGEDARKITVRPLSDEGALRSSDWIENNRRRVDNLSGGRIAYVYLPDTYADGYRSFNREYMSQVGKDAVIIDARYNGGGAFPDYIIDYLSRPLLAHWNLRDGRELPAPQEGIFGPRVMIINEMTGSGGDALAWTFRRTGLGPLIGKRTWGGLVGLYTTPDDLLDGGMLLIPNMAFSPPDGQSEIENQGVAPDIDVEDDPKAEREGHDPQLEKAVAVCLDLLRAQSPARALQHPPHPKALESK